MFSGMCYVHFLKEKGQITRLPKKKPFQKMLLQIVFFFTLKSQVFLSSVDQYYKF